MTMAKFGAARKGGSALLEVGWMQCSEVSFLLNSECLVVVGQAIRETDDGWNDVAANMLAGAYMLSPTTNIWDRCLTGGMNVRDCHRKCEWGANMLFLRGEPQRLVAASPSLPGNGKHNTCLQLSKS